MKHYKAIILCAASSAALLVSSVAFAQVGQAAPDDGTLFEELVVTAEKRAENIQDVPVAISAFSDDRREEVGITNVQDLANFTPGMAYTTGNDRVTVRGISRFTNNRSSEGGVAIYVDGVYSSSTTAGNLSTLFVERTEVLRGPQGTLYGRNSVGGAINFISKRPTREFMGEVRAGIQNYDRYDIEGSVSGPITENLRYRLAASLSDQREGFFDNLSGPSEGGRGKQSVYEAQLEGDLFDGKFDWWLKGQWVTWDNIGRGPGGRSGYTFGDYNTTTTTTGLVPYPTFGFTGTNPGNIDPFLIDVDTPNTIGLDDEQVTLQANYHFPSFDLRYVGGYHAYDYRLQTDVDATSRSDPFTRTVGGAPVSVFPRRTNSYVENPFWHSHEINLASTHEGPTQWIGGLYWFREGSNYTGIDARAPDQPQLDNVRLPLAGAPAAAPNPFRQYALNSTQNVTWSRAVFGQIEHAFSDKYKVTAGLRYTDDSRKSFESARVVCFLAAQCAPFGSLAIDFTTPVYVTPNTASLTPDPSTVTPAYYDPATGLAHRLLRNNWDAVTGTLNFDYQPDADTLIYAKYTRGYKAGGFNAGALPVSATTDPEFINAYEVGAKKTIGSRLQVNASAFFYDYRDIQAPLTEVDPNSGANRTNFFNLPRAEVLGVELEGTYFPTDRLQLLLNYSFLDASITEACCFLDQNNPTLGGQDLAGNDIPSSTPHRASFNASYTWDVAGGDLIGSASYVWRSATYYSIFNEPWNRAGAFGQVDARLIWRAGDDKYTLIGFVRNVTDEQGHLGASRPGAPYADSAQSYTLIQPRTFGVELQRRF